MPAAAQRYAGLYGRVLDTSDAGIANAAVTVVSQETGFRRSTHSDAGGSYQVSSLEPGSYKVTVRKEGFVSVVRFDLRLAAAASTHADFILPVGNIEESITVFGNTPPLEREDASTGSVVDRTEIDRLPLNGRGILTLLELAPGVNVTPATRGEAGQFTASGQRANTNYFMVDGVSANAGVAAGGLPARSMGGSLPALSAFGSLDSLISLDAVQEMRVTTSTSVAEFGRLPGATVALTSRSGTNEFHGSTAYRIRNELATANDWFGNQSGYGLLPLRMQDFGQTFGGPLERNRTFFFASYEHMTLLQPYIWKQAVPSISARQSAADWAQPVLDLFPNPTSGPLDGSVGVWVGRGNRPASLDTGSIRMDQAIGSRVSLFGRYKDAPSSNDFGTLAVNSLDLRSQSLTLGLNARAGANAVMDLRANESLTGAHSSWNQDNTPDCSLQPMTSFFLGIPAPCDYLVRFSIGGVGQLVSGREGDRRQRQFQVVESTVLRHKSHAVTLGVDYRSIVAVRRDPTGALGVIADSMPSLASTRSLWISRADAQNGTVDVKELSLWAQDTWQATSRLSVAGGLRWEDSPAPVPPDSNSYFLDPTHNTLTQQRRPLWPRSWGNFAPRLGLAYRLGSGGSTVLRAGGGLYYESSLSIATDILNGGPLSVTSFSSGINGIFPTQLTFGFMPDLRLPVVAQWNTALEHAFGARDTLSVGYLGSSGQHLLRREVGGAGSSPTSWVALTTNSGHSAYQALNFEYRRRFSAHVQALASYAWSHSLDNDSSDAFLVWAGSPVGDRGSSDFDLRHSFTGTVSFELPRVGTRRWAARLLGGWAMDAIVHARSGFPVAVLASDEYYGINLVNAFRPDQVPGEPVWLADPSTPGGRRLNAAAFLVSSTNQQGTLGRNSLEGFGMWQADMALRRDFRAGEKRRAEFRLEAFNAFNHPNFADPIAYLNSPLFGQSVSMLNLMLGTGSPGSGLAPALQTGGPRSWQATLRFQF